MASVDAKDVLGGTSKPRTTTALPHWLAEGGPLTWARATAEQLPDEVETFELTPCPPSRPVWRACTTAMMRPGWREDPAAAGEVIDPDEAFDGALVGWRQGYRATYWDQNNQAMRELYLAHGKSVNFVGCVLFYDRLLNGSRRSE